MAGRRRRKGLSLYLGPIGLLVIIVVISVIYLWLSHG